MTLSCLCPAMIKLEWEAAVELLIRDSVVADFLPSNRLLVIVIPQLEIHDLA